MEHCVLTCSSFIGSNHLNRIAAKQCRSGSSSSRSRSRVFTRCCSSNGRGDLDSGVYPQLTPKPMPRPVPVNEAEDEAQRLRMMNFWENLPEEKDSAYGEEMPDPRKDNFRAEMRRRLLYAPSQAVEDQDYAEDTEFDVFEHLVLTIRHLLHIRYKIGERLQLEDELILLEEAIPYHPDRDFKVGCGIDHIKVDVHPDFGSRCFFIVRTDQSEIDFSYRKCMMGLAQSRLDMDMERVQELIYFFKTPGGRRRSRVFSLM